MHANGEHDQVAPYSPEQPAPMSKDDLTLIMEARAKLKDEYEKLEALKAEVKGVLKRWGLGPAEVKKLMEGNLEDVLIESFLDYKRGGEMFNEKVQAAIGQQQAALDREQESILARVATLEADKQKVAKVQQEQEQTKKELEEKAKEVSAEKESIAAERAENDRTLATIQSYHAKVEALFMPQEQSEESGSASQPDVHEFEDEHALLSHVKAFIAAHGFIYEDGMVENFYTCLKSNYLTILAGISGIGKSRLPRLVADSIGARFESIPVRPNWHDDRDLLGFFNFRDNRYEATRFLDCLIRAQQEPNRLHIICLDEMNLAPVEHYFATFLSVMEDAEPCLYPDPQFTKDARNRVRAALTWEWHEFDEEIQKSTYERRLHLEQRKQAIGQAISALGRHYEVTIASNVRFVGTVNVDHTTQGLSDKVIDRANVIQFEPPDLGTWLPKPQQPTAHDLSAQQFAIFCQRHSDPQLERELKPLLNDVLQVNQILREHYVGLGFRVFRSIEQYLAFAIGSRCFKPLSVAVDLQIKQRILPKIRGLESPALSICLQELSEFAFAKEYVHTSRKLESMRAQLERGYVNYWETN